MEKVFDPQKKAGSEQQYEPRPEGSIATGMLHGYHRNTELGCDLKMLLRSDELMEIGKTYHGVMRRDSEGDIDEFYCHDAHYTFVETVAPGAARRNPHVFRGKYITVTRQDDGTLRPNFRPMPQEKWMTAERYAFKVYRELRQALMGLIEE